MSRRTQLDQWAKDFAALLDPRDAVSVVVEAFDYDNAVRVTWTGHDDGHRYTAERRNRDLDWMIRKPDGLLIPAVKVLKDLRLRREQAGKGGAEPCSAVAVPNKLTLADIEAEIASKFFFTANDGVLGSRPGFEHPTDLPEIPHGFARLTFCVLTLHNGHREVGINYGSVDPSNFSEADAQRYSYEDAISKLWNPLGFRLRDRLADPLSTWANRPLNFTFTGEIGTMAGVTLTEADAAAELAGTPQPTCTCGPGDGCTNCLTITDAELSSASTDTGCSGDLLDCSNRQTGDASLNNSTGLDAELSSAVPAPAVHAPQVIKPTIGRKVWYRPSGQDHDPMHVIDLNVPMDATVVYVWSDHMVNLLIIDHVGNQHTRTSIHLVQPGDEARPANGYAEWMPYQVGQALAVEQVAQSSACSTSFKFNGELPDA